ncbi:MAG TPA: cobalamin-dependent protein, partial [Candidatus Deferrimicrobium sp.]|nr:cobalamin-dependent protein [Candidatus Deferrimicrobium sp.]
MKYDITIANLTRSYVERETPDTFTPLGALYIASTLEKNDYNVDFRDYLTKDHNRYGDPTSPGSIFDFLEDSADILGISCGGSMLPSLLPALKILKTRYPHKTIILGGIGASGVAAELLHEFPFINIVAVGEGEETMLDLANHLCNGKSLNDVKGIIYRDNGSVCINPPRGRINDLDAVPFPNYDKIDFEDYSVISLITSRGCP